MAHEHESGLPFAYARHRGRQDVQSLVFHGKRPLLQGAELNDIQDIIRGRQERLGRLIAKDGDRTEGGAAMVDIAAGTVTLASGKIYLAGDEFPVERRVLEGVNMAGRVEIGVRLVKIYVTGDDDPSLRGLVPGALAEDEPGAAREIASIYWSTATADEDGEFYQVYVLQGGTILDQTPPPMLDGIAQALRIYDRPHGHYIVDGCRVSTLGVNAGARVFSIEEGEANIDGRKVTRHASLRHAEPEIWDVSAVPGETHIYTGGASVTVSLAHFPLDTITSILLTKERTVTLTRGALAGGMDALGEDSVISISAVVQGATTYIVEADYRLTGNNVDWGPAGGEPGVGTSYDVTFRYRASVSADAADEKTLTVSGGAAGGEIIVSYRFKLPRVDILGLLPSGDPVYIKGISARTSPPRPLPPADVLPLCEIHNSWLGEPQIIADGVTSGVRMPTWAEINRVIRRQGDHDRLIQLERMKNEIDQRDPAAKRGMFVDAFTSNDMRDAGIAQNGAVGNGILQLAIEPTFIDVAMSGPVTLDYVEEVIAAQELRTGCVKINEYQNFTPLPGKLALTPAVDFWTVSTTQWAADQTLEFQRGVSFGGPLSSTSTSVERVGGWDEALPFLRQRDVAFTISGFFPGELVDSLTFDAVDITPAGLPAADGDGEISGSFTIPAGITAGTKWVEATGMGGTVARAMFTGQGTLEVAVMQRTTTINMWSWQESSSGSNDSGERADPQAQIFVPERLRQIIGVDFHLCAIGDETNHVLVNQVSVDNGWPTTAVQAEALVPMTGATAGWKSARYGLPVTTEPDRDHAFVVKTDDGEHAVSIAALGGFDAEAQRPITAHPYPIGPRLDSVNARTWTAHQKEALAFRLVAARYPVTNKTVELGSYDLVEASDLQLRAVAALPSAACSVVFEIERANGTIYRLLPYQVLQLNEYLTETVQLRAILAGTETLSPILYAPIELVAGRIEDEALYVTKAFSVAGADRIAAYLKLALPSGSAMSVRYQLDDGAFAPLPLTATELSPQPEWVEQIHRLAGLTGNSMRIEIKLTGGPAARPRAADFGLGVM